jgi:hypothetical protein
MEEEVGRLESELVLQSKRHEAELADLRGGLNGGGGNVGGQVGENLLLRQEAADARKEAHDLRKQLRDMGEQVRALEGAVREMSTRQQVKIDRLGGTHTRMGPRECRLGNYGSLTIQWYKFWAWVLKFAALKIMEV